MKDRGEAVAQNDASGLRPASDDEMGRLLAALGPIEPALEAALVKGDKESALKIARRSLEIAGETLRPPDLIPDDMAWVQAIVLDFEPRPLVALADATLAFHDGFGLQVAHWSGVVDAGLAWDIADRFGASLDSGYSRLYLLGDGGSSLTGL
ncbi:MAG: hypothetical protein IT330_05730 [Anaerolineae bacterium]|nr:hypothetical protein [Anaerolineae bacterium]